jgi:uncharacterized protein
MNQPLAESGAATIAERLRRLDWTRIEQSLDAVGYAHTPPLLTPGECADLVASYPHDQNFRSRVVMERHRFGIGDYAYFARPLPPVVRELRTHAYRRLAPIANRWAAALRMPQRFPAALAAFLRVCHTRGQTKPTPLLLHYEAGGYNCLHRDLYGDVAFPLQLTVFLSRPDVDYRGGAFLLVEQRPRAQSVGEALTPQLGEMVIFATRDRPIAGKRGAMRAGVRHGVARVTFGARYTLGVIFHDAR